MLLMVENEQQRKKMLLTNNILLFLIIGEETYANHRHLKTCRCRIAAVSTINAAPRRKKHAAARSLKLITYM
jgi:hypothetical protein